MDIYDEELLNFWRCLNTCNVQYIMVGGFATNLHGCNTGFAGVVEIWIKDTGDNRKALRKALELSENTSFAPIERMEFIPGRSSIYIASGIELDIMTRLKSFEQERFDDCYKVASIADIDGVKVPFLHLNQLITEKRNVARNKDIEDAEALEKIRDIINKK